MKASIIIPSYNACERLYYNLLALNMQSSDRAHFEVIVVDDGSKDNTKNMLASFNANFKFRTVILKENTGRSKARNIAIEEAKGDILIFHDSDMLAEKDFVKKHIQAHEEAGTVVSGMNWNKIYTYYYKDYNEAAKKQLEKQLVMMGRSIRYTDLQQIVNEEEIKCSKFFDYEFVQSKYQETEKRIINSYGCNLEGYFYPWILFVTNNCSAFKDDILRAGRFDNAFLTWGCEDLDLGYRLYRENCRFIKAIDIKSVHQEHPVNHIRNVADNIYLFTCKYDSIDLLLFYYGGSVGIKNHTANNILSQLDKFKEDEKYLWFTELYRKLLVNLREINYKSGKNRSLQDVRKLRENIALETEAIKAVLYDLENERNLLDIAASFRILLKKALGPNYKAIKI